MSFTRGLSASAQRLRLHDLTVIHERVDVRSVVPDAPDNVARSALSKLPAGGRRDNDPFVPPAVTVVPAERSPFARPSSLITRGVDNTPHNDYPYSTHLQTLLPGTIVSPHTSDAATHTGPFEVTATPEREVYLLLQHVSGALYQELAVVLKPAGITPEQYHVLQILRDAGPDGLPCSAVAERSVSGDPDVTRLLDRLEKHGWAGRERGTTDRRVVTARITDAGRRLLAGLARPVAALHARQLERLDPRSLQALRGSLQKVAAARSDG